ncbi:hypothetical protein CMK22_10835 [Candidatus Poribacteria bacterium]|nr:hypothetical protein [Candidatus Poribacteria bacterium]
MRNLRLLLLAQLMFINPIFGQINHSGHFQLYKLIGILDQEEISLPFRLVEYQLGFSKGNVDIITNTALEYRWAGNETKVDVREAYLAWYPSWGEFKLGKQIHAWGEVDGNNPTDNLNPYDYYYIFQPGSQRKIGVLSANLKYYSDRWNFEAVVIPQHTGNRIPFDEPDFPLSQFTEFLDPRDHVAKVENPFEFGGKWQVNLKNSDLSLSGLIARDRTFSLAVYDLDQDFSVIPYFGYRKTQVLGLDGVTFYHGITFRGEIAYFKTRNDLSGDYTQPILLESEAEYSQYAFQAEFTVPFEIIVSSQFLGSQTLKMDGAKVNKTTMMGMPFAIIADRGLLILLSRTFMDNALELSSYTFYNLEMNSFMLDGKMDYSLGKNLAVNFGFTQFFGNENELEDRFNDLESFSHVQISLKYNF